MKYRVHEEVICQAMGGLYYLMAYGQAKKDLGFMTPLNETGAFYWRLLEEGKGREEILSQACQRYGAAAKDLEQGLDRFLGDLCVRGYLRPDPEE